MKKLKNILVIFYLIILFPAQARAGFPRLKGFVNDTVPKINSKFAQRIEKLLVELERKTGAEIYIAVVKSLDGYSADRYGGILYKKWRIGYRKKDQGVLLLVSLEKRKVRILVGEGLKGVITSEERARIRKEKLLPFFSKEEYAAGILVGVSEMVKLISEKKGVKIEALNFKTRTRLILDPVVIALYSFMIMVILILIGVPFLTRILPYLKRRSAKKQQSSSL